MNTTRHIAVIDIGKTNAKLALVNQESLQEIDVRTRPNTVLAGPPWPHFDVEGHWDFLLNGLRDFHEHYGIDGISITTHGACVALLDHKGNLAAPILDYEHDAPDKMAEAYDVLRPEFAETGSPRLPAGLNIGAQLHWQFKSDPELLGRVHTIVTYPQYWAHKLSGKCAVDICSIGCHSDLWNPIAGCYSSLADKLGIRDKLAPVRKPNEVLGSLLPEVAKRTGLSIQTPVLCGIHDSNASLYAHLTTLEPPFNVISTGTWVVTMTVTDNPHELDPKRDTLMNVSATGKAVPSARFMGGREFELIQQGTPLSATRADALSTLANGTMLLPAVETSSGPFAGAKAHWRPAEPPVAHPEREVALAYYLALMSFECLKLAGGEGPIVVEGPFARNRFYLDMLQALAENNIIACESATGTSTGAALLFGGSTPPQKPLPAIEPGYRLALQDYAEHWLENLA